MKNQTDCHGFVLITVILAIVLVSLVGGLLQLELLLTATVVTEAETQLRSQVLAENGIELARSVIAAADVQDLLVGNNGVPDCAGLSGWRDPIPLETAWQEDLSRVRSDCDDGLAWMLGETPDSPALGSADEGWTLIRFSNDPVEAPDEDHNDTIVVRSMGVVPSRLRRTARFAGRNNVTIVEACLRRERAFAVETALTLVGKSAGLLLAGSDSIIAGVEAPPIDIVEVPEAGLAADVEEAIEGLGMPGRAYRNVTGERVTDPAFSRLLDPAFWAGFEERWSRLATGRGDRRTNGGVHILPEGASLEGELSGLFLVRGDVVLRTGTRLSGYLVHLGGGGLRFEPGAAVCGGLWMSSLDCMTGERPCERIRLEMPVGARLDFERETVRRALASLPPTQLMWRILFPELG